MTRIFDPNPTVATFHHPVVPGRNVLEDDEKIDGTSQDARSRWPDFEDDDNPFDPMDDDDDYEDFQWEEVPDNGQVLPPDELSDDDWD